MKKHYSIRFMLLLALATRLTRKRWRVSAWNIIQAMKTAGFIP